MFKTIALSNGLNVKVSAEDFDELSKHFWGAISNKSGHTYAARGTRKKGKKYSKILMHRVILGNPKNKMVDHINGNTLDNRREIYALQIGQKI